MQVQLAAQERNWAMAAHLSALVAVAGLPFGHIVGPLDRLPDQSARITSSSPSMRVRH